MLVDTDLSPTPTPNKVMLIEDQNTAIKAGDDGHSLVITIPKSLTRRQ